MSSSPRLFGLAWPLMVELLLAIALGLVGTGLAAQVSDAAGGAFSLANQISAALFVLFRVIGAGVSVVVTQNLGGGRRDEADRVALAVLGASSWLGLFTGLLSLLFAGPLMRLMQSPPEVLPIATPFLMAMAPALLLDAWNASMAAVMRAHLRTRDTLLVLVLMHLCHLLLAVPLMRGWGPLPALGLPGFALALALSRALGLALHLALWAKTLQLQLRPQRSDWWRLPRRQLADVLHIGLPGAAENIAHRLCFMVTVAVAAQLGTQALATHAYVLQLQGVVIMFSLSISFAVEIMVGHLVGAGRLHTAHQLVRRALLTGLAVSVVLAALAALATPWLLSGFTSDPAIVSSGQTLMWITVLVEAGRTFNLVLINGLRAAGDARYPMYVGAVSMPAVMAGGGWLLAGPLGWGLVGLWLAYAADEWLRGLLMWRRWLRLGWVPHARGVRRRMRLPVLPLSGRPG
ncbi:MATE family efflux transporter [Paucibacter sp. M5-1]|uniref:MATE family efflux transporter n=1 Tax=Paucibacter sp. M5-1 TaxID=3015998 RepID=UPI0022B8E851|nr:MATE family efflux transporter [Paucibacter sp. M5-1]MCZ7883056.1 MATE family efflux transporter [Paucibacter sp. M5-1]